VSEGHSILVRTCLRARPIPQVRSSSGGAQRTAFEWAPVNLVAAARYKIA
jgi:hypothetical protein